MLPDSGHKGRHLNEPRKPSRPFRGRTGSAPFCSQKRKPRPALGQRGLGAEKNEGSAQLERQAKRPRERNLASNYVAGIR